MLRSFRSLLLILVAVVALAGCGKDDKGGEEAKPPKQDGAVLSGDAPVRISNFEFKPRKILVKPGTKVTWTNDDTQIHDVKDTSPLANPPGPPMPKGDTFAITYAQPGSYSYVCEIHPYMTGTVEVVP